MMSYKEARWLLENIDTPCVRIDPRARPTESNGHWGRARLISATETHAMVQPFGHKREERIELRYVQNWKSKNLLEMPEEPAPTKAKLGDIARVIKPQPKPEPIMQPKPQIDAPPQTVSPPKFQRRAIPRAEYEQIERFIKEGRSYVEIEKITGRNKGTVGGIASKMRRRGEAIPVQIQAPAPVVIAEAPIIVEPMASPTVGIEALHAAIRSILSLKINDSAKLLAIEALLS